MFKNSKRTLALLLALILAVGLFAACQQEPPAPAPPDEPADEAAPPPPVDEPPDEPAAVEQILRFGTTGIDGRFNSILANNVYDSYVNSLVFDALISNDIEGNVMPWAAESWERSADNLTYTFVLHENITFSDGVPMTTADVAFTFNTMAHPDYDGPRSSAVSNMLGFAAVRAGDSDFLEGIEIIDDRTISFTFYEAGPANIWNSFVFGILPEHYYAFETWDEFLDLQSAPMGSGRFVLEEYRPMEFIRLAANRNHWHPDRVPQLDNILMLEVPEELLLDAFATDQIDVAQPSTTLDNYNAFGAVAGVTLRNVLDNGYQQMTFNTLRPQLEDVRVRQALMYALDREAFIAATVGPLGSVGLAPISPVSWAFPDVGELNAYPFDMDRARELMTEAGWEPGPDGILVNADGVRMELTWPVYTEVPWPGILSELAADSWGQLGVDLNIELMDFGTVIARTTDTEPGEADFCVYVMGWSLAIDPDPTGSIFDYDEFVAGGFFASGWFNADSQRLIAEGRAEFDQAVRAEIYKEWATLLNYHIPTIVIAYRDMLWVVRDTVNNLVIESFEDWTYHIHNVTIG